MRGVALSGFDLMFYEAPHCATSSATDYIRRPVKAICGIGGTRCRGQYPRTDGAKARTPCTRMRSGRSIVCFTGTAQHPKARGLRMAAQVLSQIDTALQLVTLHYVKAASPPRYTPGHNKSRDLPEAPCPEAHFATTWLGRPCLAPDLRTDRPTPFCLALSCNSHNQALS